MELQKTILIYGLIILAFIICWGVTKSIASAIQNNKRKSKAVAPTPKKHVPELNWSRLEVLIAVYLVQYQSYKSLNETYIKLIAGIIGRSEAALLRKLQRINTIQHQVKGHSALDKDIWYELKRKGKDVSTHYFLEAITNLGGDPGVVATFIPYSEV